MVVTWVGLKSIIMDAGVPSVKMAGASMMQMSSVGMFATIILSLKKALSPKAHDIIVLAGIKNMGNSVHNAAE